MPSQSIWKKQSSILQEDANSISILKKQINKQTEIDASVQSSIDDKIEILKKNACLLANKLQNEKHKNHELETIIGHMKNKMEAEKLQEASFRNNINSQNLASLENKLKKLQYDLGQVNIKTNRLSQNVEKKRSKISQNRTERVIDSGIFRNIEKELIDSELRFKKLLIEKVKHEKQYQKILSQYSSLKEKAEKYGQKDSQKNKSIHQVRQSNLKNEESKSKVDLNKFKKMQTVRQTKGRSPTIKCNQQTNFQQERYVISMKKLLSQTGLQSNNELLYLFQNVDQINQKYFNQINNYLDQANQIQRYLAEAKKVSSVKAIPSSSQGIYKKQAMANKLCRQTKQHIKAYNDQLEKDIQSFINFFESQNFSKFVKELDVQLPPLKEGQYFNYQTLTQTLQLLESNIQQFLIQSSHNVKSCNSKGKSTDALQEMMSHVKKSQEYLKVMKKQEFQEQYHKIAKTLSQKFTGARHMTKKKTYAVKK